MIYEKKRGCLARTPLENASAFLESASLWAFVADNAGDKVEMALLRPASRN